MADTATPPAPSPAAAPPPPTVQATATEKPAAELMGDIEADFADLDAGRPVRQRDGTGKFKPADRPPEKPADQPPDKPAADVKPPEKPAETPPDEKRPTRMRELGEAYDGMKKQIETEYKPKIQKLESKVQELESRKPEDTAPVLAKIQALEKETATLRQQLAEADSTQDPEVQKIDLRYSEAWSEALNVFQQLRVSEKTPDGIDENTGEPKFKVERRPATEDDLLKLARLPLQDMYDTSAEMFGNAAPEVIRQLGDIRKLYGEKERALKEAKTGAATRKSQRQLEAQNRQKQSKEAWDSINAGLQEKFPKAFKVDETDSDDKAAHMKGFALADLLFLGEKTMTPEQIEALPASFRDTVKAGKPLSDVQKVQLHAITRLKIANHDRLVPRLKKATARIDELEKVVADYEKSEPSSSKAGEHRRTETGNPMEIAEAEIRALDKN